MNNQNATIETLDEVNAAGKTALDEGTDFPKHLVRSATLHNPLLLIRVRQNIGRKGWLCYQPQELALQEAATQLAKDGQRAPKELETYFEEVGLLERLNTYLDALETIAKEAAAKEKASEEKAPPAKVELATEEEPALMVAGA